MSAILFLALVFMMGASLGSFGNLVAWRLPLGLSIVSPPSLCPSCGQKIALPYLLPVFGWALTRGRCHACESPINIRYALVELSMGLMAVALWLRFSGASILPSSPYALLHDTFIPFVLYLSFATGLLVLSLIDFDWFLLPDRLTLPLALLGFLSSLALASSQGTSLSSSAEGAFLLGILPLSLGFLYTLLTGRVGLGGGDWKLGLAIGAWLGPMAVPFVLLLASLLGLLFALLFHRDLRANPPPPLDGEEEALHANGDRPQRDGEAPPLKDKKGGLYIPFGPFLALSAMAWLLFEVPILQLGLAFWSHFS